MNAPLVDRYADAQHTVHSPIVAWAPTAPAPLSQSYLAAVDAYLTTDRDTVAQQRGTT